MVTHIGNLVAAKMQEKHISIVTLASRLQMGRVNVDDILKRKSMQTALLDKIGKAMNYDFFQHYSTAEADKKMQNELLQQKLQEAEAEIRTLNRIIDALKAK